MYSLWGISDNYIRGICEAYYCKLGHSQWFAVNPAHASKLVVSRRRTGAYALFNAIGCAFKSQICFIERKGNLSMVAPLMGDANQR
jgi:hypothetical protein